MVANAPYFQLRSPHGHFTNTSNETIQSPDNGDYDVPSTLATHHHGLHADPQFPSTSDVQNTTLDENHNLIELVEAATTAAGQAKKRSMDIQVEKPDDDRSSSNRRKRKRRSSSSPEDVELLSITKDPEVKRARRDVPTDPQLTHISSEFHGHGDSVDKDAWPATIHSAAALFRQPSKEPPKKCTRPPMSKLFVSLQLSPENFLHLQARAKAYMLDPSHPERQSCVGNRGKGDNDLVKLRLFNCVQDFLNDGAGESFFGENVETPARKDTMNAARALGEDKAMEDARLLWPKDGNKIISLVTPLLRRMVTNERQRMYAIETRKGGKRQESSVERSHDRNSMDAPTLHREQVYSDLLQARRSSHSKNPTVSITSSIRPRSESTGPIIRPSQSLSSLGIFHMNDQDNDVSAIQETILPTNNHPVLRKIHIFLSKDGIRLKQKEHVTGPDPLFDYPWVQLQHKVSCQVKLALAAYPQLRPAFLRSSSRDQLHQQLKGMGPKALHSLAVAASEFHRSALNANKTINPELRVDSVSNDAMADPTTNSEPLSEPAFTNLYTQLPGLSDGQTLASALGSTLVSPGNAPSVRSGHDSLIGSVFDGSSLDASTRGIAPNSNATSPSHSRPPTSASQRDISEREEEQEGSPSAVPPPGSLLSSSESHSAARNALEEAGTGLPKYMIKAMLTTGLTLLRDERDWENAKSDVGLSVWADGRMSVVVEIFC